MVQNTNKSSVCNFELTQGAANFTRSMLYVFQNSHQTNVEIHSGSRDNRQLIPCKAATTINQLFHCDKRQCHLALKSQTKNETLVVHIIHQSIHQHRFALYVQEEKRNEIDLCLGNYSI